MTPKQTAASYDLLAERWLEPGLDRNGIAAHERALAFRPDGGRALDVGCGCSGRFLRLLEGRGYEVEGLDLSARMIALARERFPGRTFHEADICAWEAPGDYDFITAWDSIWHVPLAAAEGVLQKLCGALRPGGVLIWTTAGLDGPAEKTDASMGAPVYYGVPGLPRTLELVADAGCVCRHLEYDQYPEKHVYLIAQKPDPAAAVDEE